MRALGEYKVGLLAINLCVPELEVIFDTGVFLPRHDCASLPHSAFVSRIWTRCGGISVCVRVAKYGELSTSARRGARGYGRPAAHDLGMLFED